MSGAGGDRQALLLELLRIDDELRRLFVRREAVPLPLRERRADLSSRLNAWALGAQRGQGGEQRRAHPRAALALPVEIVGLEGGPRAARTLSISAGGLGLAIVGDVALGDRLTVRVSPPPPDATFEAVAEVVWFEQELGHAGLRFEALPEEGRDLIERLVLQQLVAGR